MTTLIIDIIEALNKHNLEMDNHIAYMAIELALEGYNITPKSTSLTLLTDIPDMVKYYFACRRLAGIEVSTLKNYSYTLRHFSDIVNKPVASISLSDIRGYLFMLTQKGLKASTMDNKINCLKSFFGWLLKEGKLSASGDPTSTIESPKKPKRIRKGLSIEHLELSRNACESTRDRALIEVLLSTGCRLSEIIEVKLSDIHNNSFHVIGKGDKERIVYLSDKAMFYLKIYINDRIDKSDYMFTSERIDKKLNAYTPIHAKAIEMAINKIGKRCNLHLYPHIYRHTFASMLADQGVDLQYIQELLGHSDPKTTKIYAVVSQKSLKSIHQNSMVA